MRNRGSDHSHGRYGSRPWPGPAKSTSSRSSPRADARPTWCATRGTPATPSPCSTRRRPRAAVERVLDTVAPTHLVDIDGRRPAPRRAPGARRAPPQWSSPRARPAAPRASSSRSTGAIAIGHGWAGAIGPPPGRPLVPVPAPAPRGRARDPGPRTGDRRRGDRRRRLRPRRGRRRARPRSAPRSCRSCPRCSAGCSTPARPCTSTAASSPAARRCPRAAGPGRLRSGVPVYDAYGQSETWGGCVADGVPIPGAAVRLGPGDEIEISGADGDARLPPRPGGQPARVHPRRLAAHRRRRPVHRRRSARGRRPPARPRDHRRRQREPGRGRAGARRSTPRSPTSPWWARPTPSGASGWWPTWCRATRPRRRRSTHLRAFARDRLTAPKLPRELVLVAVVPRSTGGKILRRELRGDTPA